MMESKKKKTAGAFLSAIVVIALMIGYIYFLFWIRLQEAFPLVLFWVMTVIYILIIAAVIAVLIQRLKEIKGGEEEEAKKY